MKTIELDIDNAKNPKQIYDKLWDGKPERGDHFKVLTSYDKKSFHVMMAVAVIMVAIVYVMANKKISEIKPSFAEDILKKLFGKYNSVEEIEKEIEKEGYQVDIEQKTKDEPDKESDDWQNYSVKRFGEYFSGEDDISHLVVKEPNPHYRK